MLNQLDKVTRTLQDLNVQNEKISFGTGISQPVFDASDFGSNQDWDVANVPVRLGRYDHPYTPNWQGEDGL